MAECISTFDDGGDVVPLEDEDSERTRDSNSLMQVTAFCKAVLKPSPPKGGSY